MKTEDSEIGMRDCINMGVGIAIATDVESSKKIANFINEQHKGDIKFFINFIEKEIENINEKKKGIKEEIDERKMQSFEHMEHLLDAFLSHLNQAQTTQ